MGRIGQCDHSLLTETYIYSFQTGASQHTANLIYLATHPTERDKWLTIKKLREARKVGSMSECSVCLVPCWRIFCLESDVSINAFCSCHYSVCRLRADHSDSCGVNSAFSPLLGLMQRNLLMQTNLTHLHKWSESATSGQTGTLPMTAYWLYLSITGSLDCFGRSRPAFTISTLWWKVMVLN